MDESLCNLGRGAVYLSLEGRNYRLEDSNSITSSCALIHHVRGWADDMLLSNQANCWRSTRWCERQEKGIHTRKEKICVDVLTVYVWLCYLGVMCVPVPSALVKTVLPTGGLRVMKFPKEELKQGLDRSITQRHYGISAYTYIHTDLQGPISFHTANSCSNSLSSLMAWLPKFKISTFLIFNYKIFMHWDQKDDLVCKKKYVSQTQVSGIT